MEIAVIGGFTDAGGFILYVGSDGKLHVRRVPPWNPETLGELKAAVGILEFAGQLRNAKVQEELVGIAQRIAAPHVGELQKAVGG